jgi:hypothetical protein
MSDAWAKVTESVIVCGENSKSKDVLGSVSQLLVSPPKNSDALRTLHFQIPFSEIAFDSTALKLLCLKKV